MKTTRDQALSFLANNQKKDAATFNEGFQLLRNTVGVLPAQERHLNKVGFNSTTIGTVIYELKKLHKITDQDLKKVAAVGAEELGKVISLKSSLTEEMPPVISQLIEALRALGDAERYPILFYIFFDIDSEAKFSDELKEYAKNAGGAYGKFLKDHPDLKKEVFKLDFAIVREGLKEFLETFEMPEEFKAELETPAVDANLVLTDDAVNLEVKAEIVKVFEAAPEPVKEAVKFRDEFPFLSDPTANVPSELKELVTDKFAHFHTFEAAHAELFNKLVVPGSESKIAEEVQAISDAEIFTLAKKAVENFTADQLIWAELVHFRDNNKVLGAHPIFRQRRLQEAVNKMTIPEAGKRLVNLENYIRRDGKKAEEATNIEDKAKFEEKVVQWKAEEVLVNLKLGASATK